MGYDRVDCTLLHVSCTCVLTYQPHYIHVLVGIYSSTSTHVFFTLNLSSFFVTSCLLSLRCGLLHGARLSPCSYRNWNTAGLGGCSIKAEAKSCVLCSSAHPCSHAPAPLMDESGDLLTQSLTITDLVHICACCIYYYQTLSLNMSSFTALAVAPTPLHCGR